MERRTVEVLVGIGGWEHEVLDQCLYGAPGWDATAKLRMYARSFRTVEVRPTFWDETLSGADARQWVEAVSGEKGFLFQVKLHSSFTHQKQIRPAVARSTREILEVLAGANRLGGLLMQFPYAFTNVGAHRSHLQRLAEEFREFPCFVELRHDSWNQPGLTGSLARTGLRIVQSDMPRLRQYMPFTTGIIGEIAYLRLHGRNERGWLQNGMDARYDYLYNGRELREISRRIEAMVPRCSRVIIICNNTTNGKAVANAFQLMAVALNRKVQIPQASLKGFPQLAEIAPGQEGHHLFIEGEYRQAM
jgi:uncharacterized protein YecE (DUF72 family)